MARDHEAAEPEVYDRREAEYFRQKLERFARKPKETVVTMATKRQRPARIAKSA